MENKNLSVREVQMLELEILKVFDTVCRTHGITYTLAYGTLLGAVRHKGFIPWDDDIDVIVPRPQYTQLIELIQNKSLPEGYSAGIPGESSYIYPYIKIYKENTHVIEKKHEKAYSSSRIWIDVFPMDGLPADRKKAERVLRYSRFLRDLLYSSIVKPSTVTGTKKIATILLKPITKLLGPTFFSKRIHTISQKWDYSSSSTVGNIAWGSGLREGIQKEDYEQTLSLEFEDGVFPAPVAFNKRLTSLYDEYMELPPLEMQKAHLGEAYLLKNGKE